MSQVRLPALSRETRAATPREVVTGETATTQRLSNIISLLRGFSRVRLLHLIRTVASNATEESKRSPAVQAGKVGAAAQQASPICITASCTAMRGLFTSRDNHVVESPRGTLAAGLPGTAGTLGFRFGCLVARCSRPCTTDQLPPLPGRCSPGRSGTILSNGDSPCLWGTAPVVGGVV